MRVAPALLFAGLCACAPPTLELRVTRFSVSGGVGRVELLVGAFEPSGAPGVGDVRLAVEAATAERTTLALDAEGFARFSLECPATTTRCDELVRVTATWKGQEAGLESHFGTASVGSVTSNGPAEMTYLGASSAQPMPPSSTSTCPRTRFFGGGATELTLRVEDTNGAPAESTVTLAAAGRTACATAGTDGLVTFFEVPGGPASATTSTVKGSACQPLQPCVTGWAGKKTPLTVPARGVVTLPVASGW